MLDKPIPTSMLKDIVFDDLQSSASTHEMEENITSCDPLNML